MPAFEKSKKVIEITFQSISLTALINVIFLQSPHVKFAIKFVVVFHRLANDSRPGRLRDSKIMVDFKILVDRSLNHDRHMVHQDLAPEVEL